MSDFFVGYLFGLIVSMVLPGPIYRLIIYDKGWFPNGYLPRKVPHD